MSDADIDAFTKAQNESMAAVRKELEAQGVTAEDVGRAMNEGMTQVLRNTTRDMSRMSAKELEQASAAVADARGNQPAATVPTSRPAAPAGISNRKTATVDMGAAMRQGIATIDPDEVRALSSLTAAHDALRHGDVPTAQTKAEEGLRSRADHPGLRCMRAKLNALTGKVAEAESELDEVIQHTPRFDWAHGLRALFRVAQRDWDGARRSAEAALSLNATQPEALLALAQLDLTERKVTDAIAKLERNVTADPDFDDARFLYAMLLAENGQTAKAIAELETLCQRNPYTIAARERLIAYYAREANEPDEAWRHIRELEKLNHPKAKQYRNELEQILKTQPPETP